MVDKRALGEPRNVVVEDYTHFDQLQEWANAVKGTEVHLWPQINHPGSKPFHGSIRKLWPRQKSLSN